MVPALLAPLLLPVQPEHRGICITQLDADGDANGVVAGLAPGVELQSILDASLVEPLHGSRRATVFTVMYFFIALHCVAQFHKAARIGLNFWFIEQGSDLGSRVKVRLESPQGLLLGSVGRQTGHELPGEYFV
jgi:hypothetical protein